MSYTKRIEKPADDTPTSSQGDGLCHAFGCPLTGTISPATKEGGPWLCRFHFNKDAKHWPEITHRIRTEGLTDAPLRELKITMTPEQARAFLKARKHMAPFAAPGKAWAYALRTREECGEQLDICQKEAWRAVLGENAPSRKEVNEAERELQAERLAIQASGA